MSITEELSEYELQRMRNINDRKRMFAELAIEEAVAAVGPVGLAKPPKVVKSKPVRRDSQIRSVDPLSLRKSARLKNKESTDFSEVVTEIKYVTRVDNAEAQLTRPPLRRFTSEELLDERFSVQLDEDLRLKSLSSMCSQVKLSTKSDNQFNVDFGKAICQESVKVVSDRIFAMDFNARSDISLLAVGDKWGGIALWHVDRHDDSLHNFRYHSRPVNAMNFDKFHHTRLISTSYDNSMRSFDLSAMTCHPIWAASEDDDADNFNTNCHCQLEPNVWLVGTGRRGDLIRIDSRSTRTRQSDVILSATSNIAAESMFPPHGGGIKAIDVHPLDSTKLAAASNSGSCSILDIRHIKKGSKLDETGVQKLTGHTRSTNDIKFSLDSGSHVATIALDDRVNVFDTSTGELIWSVKHNNQTGRWLTPFRLAWLNDSSFVCGSMIPAPRHVDFFDVKQRQQHTIVRPDTLTTVCSIFAVDRQHRRLAGSNASGRVNIFNF